MAQEGGGATFDPQVPQEQPKESWFMSKPIDTPHFASAQAALTRGAGEEIKGIGEVADKTAHAQIDWDVHRQTDALADDYLQRLGAMDKVVNPENTLLADNQQKNTPGSIKNLPGTLDTLTAARANGKMSETYYWAKLYGLGKEMRSKYPGYRDYTDQVFANATGAHTTANRLMSSLVQDINTSVAANKEATNKIDTKLLDGVTRGDITAQQYQSFKQGGTDSTTLLNFMYQKAKFKSDLEIQDLQMRNAQAQRTLGKQQAEDLTTDQLGKSASAAVTGMTISFPGLQTQNMPQFMDYIRQHPLSDEQGVQVRMILEQEKQAWVAQERLRGNADRTDPKTGKSLGSWSSFVGSEAYEKNIQEKSKLFDGYLDLFPVGSGTEKVGIGNAHKVLAQAALDDTSYNLIKDPVIGGWVSNMSQLAKLDPRGATLSNFFNHLTLDPAVAAYQAPWMAATGAAALAQPTLSQGTPFTLPQAVEQGRNKGLNGADAAPAHNALVTSIPKVLTDPKAPPDIKRNMAVFAFGDEDKNVMDLYNQSLIKNDGTLSPGKSTAYATLVNEKVGASIKKINDPRITKNYVDSSEKFFGSIFNSEILTLNKIAPEGVGIGGATSSYEKKAYSLLWDDKSNHWTLDIKGLPGGMLPGNTHTEYLARHGQGVDFGDLTYSQLSEARTMQNTITKLNLGIDSLMSTEKQFGTPDVPATLLRLFVQSGLEPSQEPTSPAGQLFQAVVKAHPQQPVEAPADGSADKKTPNKTTEK